MQSVTVNPILYNEMIELYSDNSFRKLMRLFAKNAYIRSISCRTASEFDKLSGISNIDKIIEFVSLQIILRVTADDKNYSEVILEDKDSLLQQTGLVFNTEIVNEIKKITYNDISVKGCLHGIVVNKLLKLQDIFDDNIIYLTKAFCSIISQ